MAGVVDGDAGWGVGVGVCGACFAVAGLAAAVRSAAPTTLWGEGDPYAGRRQAGHGIH